MAPVDFDYDLEEIVQMDGVGPISLKSALKRMPDRIGVLSMLHRDAGKNPSFFNAAQIEALLERYRSDFTAGNPPGHREADEEEFSILRQVVDFTKLFLELLDTLEAIRASRSVARGRHSRPALIARYDRNGD
jgi:hypothetical protein